MSYHTEIGQSRYEAFYFEFLMVDAETGDALPSDGIDHQLRIYSDVCNYGLWCQTGQIVASNSNGLIYPTTQRGISAIKIPPSNFGAFRDCASDFGTCRNNDRIARGALIAVPSLSDDAKLISTFDISFGNRSTMARVTYKATPYYPAPAIPALNATQVMIQLNKVPGQYDLVEAGLPNDPLDPARLTWDKGGPVVLGGPLSNSIAATLGYDPAAMTIFLVAAAANQT